MRVGPLRVETEREDDGHWVAELVALPGVLAYGHTREEARARAEALAFRGTADRMKHGEQTPEPTSLFAAG